MSVENNMHTYLSPEFFQEDSHEFVETTFSTATTAAVSAEDIFNLLEALEGVSPNQLINPLAVPVQSHDDAESISLFGSILEAPACDNNDQQEESTNDATTLTTSTTRLVTQKSTSSTIVPVDLEESENEHELDKEAGVVKTCAKKIKKQKLSTNGAAAVTAEEEEGQQKICHIAVERNRRKQMNDNLTVLRSLMPSFYVKRGDQASIVGGVVDYITELQQVLQSLEAKKQRKLICCEVLSPRQQQQQTQQLISSTRLSNNLPISPRKPPLSPRLLAPALSSVPSSPTTPQPTNPYKNHYQTNSLLHYPLPYLSPTSMLNTLLAPSPSSSSCSTSNSIDHANELVAHSKSAVADVEVKFSGPHVLLKTISHRVPGQAVKIISALEDLSLEILNVSLKIIDELTMLNSFTIKIGIECQLSAEELAHLIQQTFC